MNNKEMAQRIVDVLNEMLEADRPAVGALIANRVPCNHDLAVHPTVQCQSQHGGYFLGMLGVLNGICGIHEDSTGHVAAVFDDHDNEGEYQGNLRFLSHFVVYSPEDDNEN